ncbi:uncharacterized protein BROUX77_003952 [Berkeleyomyces rouxiae]|uniref:uncharacterized protein n=1 Tax=Berkeleyomyces rouxiae TaxID=2035830 RepID=UPI003B7685D5
MSDMSEISEISESSESDSEDDLDFHENIPQHIQDDLEDDLQDLLVLQSEIEALQSLSVEDPIQEAAQSSSQRAVNPEGPSVAFNSVEDLLAGNPRVFEKIFHITRLEFDVLVT